MDRSFGEFYEAHRALSKSIVRGAGTGQPAPMYDPRAPIAGRSLDPYQTPMVNRGDELNELSNEQARTRAADVSLIQSQLREVLALNGSGDWRAASAILAQQMKKVVLARQPG